MSPQQSGPEARPALRDLTPERRRMAEELFLQAIALQGSERSAWISQACGDDGQLATAVLSLVSGHIPIQAGAAAETRTQPAGVDFPQHASIPGRAGPYRLLSELGRGGMGTVFLAERDDEHYRSRVAIKLVRPGMDTDFILARFRLERQVLARLEHPNIARLLDGGSTAGGLPYIVMEYVDGLKITEYARKHKLDVGQRVELFIPVCQAIDYAHHNLIVHRDLKPGNILVDGAGSPKLLDFGISKLLYTEPQKGDESTVGMMTPEYASPEQLRGDSITVASDVYSLGAVLYELLTGARPYRAASSTPYSIERAICEQDAPLPSAACGDQAIARHLVGDLDNILNHALEKEPHRRYESAAQLAGDLRHYLAHEPVIARPQTLRYRSLKYIRRNRAAVALTAAIMIVLIAGAALYRHEAIVARRRLDQVRGLANKFVFDVHDAVRDLPGSMRARQLIAQTGLDYLDALSQDARGEVQFEKELAAAYRGIGDVQGDVAGANLGNTPAALASYRKALGLLRDASARQPPDLALQAERLGLYRRIANIESRERPAQEALRTYDEALALGEKSGPQADPRLLAELAELYVKRSDLRRAMGVMQEAFDDATRGLALYHLVDDARPALAATMRSIAVALASLGLCELRLGRQQDASAHFQLETNYIEQAIRLEPNSVSHRRELMQALMRRADLLGNPNGPNLGLTAAAREVYAKAVAIAKDLQASDPADQRARADYGLSLARLASTMPDQDPRAKLAIERESIGVLREGLRIDPGNTNLGFQLASAIDALGDSVKRFDPPAAQRAWRECTLLSEPIAMLGQRSALVLAVLCDRKLAEASAQSGDRKQSLAFAGHAVTLVDSALRNASTGLIAPRAYAAMGIAYAALAHSKSKEATDRRQAREWLSKALDAWKQAQSQPGFGRSHQIAMREVEDALAALGRP